MEVNQENQVGSPKNVSMRRSWGKCFEVISLALNLSTSTPQFTPPPIGETSGDKLGIFDILPPLNQCLTSKVIHILAQRTDRPRWYLVSRGSKDRWLYFQSLILVRTKKPTKCFSVMLLLVNEYERESRSRERLMQSSYIKTANDF